MHWIFNFHLFLFDFDGLLVNTEKLHYEAYKRMCQSHGVTLDWGEVAYCRVAMRSATAFKETLLSTYPQLNHTPWEILYKEKKEHYKDLLKEGKVEFMSGAKELLLELARADIRRCVVTHSPLEQVVLIKEMLPELKTIPFWITREDYSQPKPHPECYLRAVEKHGRKGDRIIGFEDSPRGLNALLDASIPSVLVTTLFEKNEVGQNRPFNLVPNLKVVHFD